MVFWQGIVESPYILSEGGYFQPNMKILWRYEKS